MTIRLCFVGLSMMAAPSKFGRLPLGHVPNPSPPKTQNPNPTLCTHAYVWRAPSFECECIYVYVHMHMHTRLASSLIRGALPSPLISTACPEHTPTARIKASEVPPGGHRRLGVGRSPSLRECRNARTAPPSLPQTPTPTPTPAPNPQPQPWPQPSNPDPSPSPQSQCHPPPQPQPQLAHAQAHVHVRCSRALITLMRCTYAFWRAPSFGCACTYVCAHVQVYVHMHTFGELPDSRRTPIAVDLYSLPRAHTHRPN